MKSVQKVAVALCLLLVAAIFFAWYAMTWSERFLRPVHKGMTQNQVLAVIGSPLKTITRTNDIDAWYYSTSRWVDAVVYFDTNRIVSAIETD